MPELPEVETTVRGLAPHVEGLVIQKLVIRQPQLRWPVPEGLAATLHDLSIKSVGRRAKYILFSTGQGTIIVHLGMSGSLRILAMNTPAEKHDHADWIFSNDTVMRFRDPRRFGAILWTEDSPEKHVLLKDLGPEPLLDTFDGDYLHSRAKLKKTPVKSFVMDSHIVVGVGNIYANEALFLSGILPTRLAGDITQDEFRNLASAIKAVLSNAIAQGGTTLRDFVNETGNPGYFKQQLNVYGRGNMPCRLCLKPLTEIRINNRSTVFCPCCQK